MRVPVALYSAKHRFLSSSAQDVLNFFPEAQPAEAKSRVGLIPTPGLVSYTNLPEFPIRGRAIMAGNLYVAAGLSVFMVNGTGAVTLVGPIEGGVAPLSMAASETQLVIVNPDTGTGWVVNTTANIVQQITDPDYQPSVGVAFLNGRFVFAKKDSGGFFWSEIDDAASMDGLGYSEADGYPDNLVTVARVAELLWAFGRDSIELLQVTSDPDRPYARVQGGTITGGTSARDSVVVLRGVPYWLGGNRVFYRGNGFNAERISTHAIEQALQGYENVSDLVCWAYEMDGHAFYVATFPGAGATWVYDQTTQAWHRRESEGYAGWRAMTGITFGDAVIGCDAKTSALYRVDPNVATEAGQQIIRQATGTNFTSEGRRVFLDRVQLDMEAGQGLPVGQGSDPIVTMQVSRDGGHTFGLEKRASMGRMGEFKRRAEWRQNGAGRDLVLRFNIADPVPHMLHALNVDLEPGES